MNHPHDRQKCILLAERLSEYLDGELPPELRDRVEEHFDDCVDCERFLLSLTRVKGMGHLLPLAELPPERLKELAEAVRRQVDS